MSKPLDQILRTAKPEVLQEIVREAESRLEAQQTFAMAADSRAMNFLGFVAAIAVATVGASASIISSNLPLAILGLLVGCGFTFSGHLAFDAAKPIEFQTAGSYPSGWVADVTAGVSFHDAMAQQASNYDSMLNENRLAMDANAKKLMAAAKAAVHSTAIGVIGILVYVLAMRLGVVAP